MAKKKKQPNRTIPETVSLQPTNEPTPELEEAQEELATEYDLPPDAFLILLVSQRISGRIKQTEMIEKLQIFSKNIGEKEKFATKQKMTVFLGQLSSIATELQRQI